MGIEGIANTEYASLSGKIRTFVVDKSLTISGACADAKATGDAIAKVDARVNENSIAQRVQNEIDKQAVKKIGDTMTGNLRLYNSNTNTSGLVGIGENGEFIVGTDSVMSGDFGGMFIALDAVGGNAFLHDESGDHTLLHSSNLEALKVARVVSGTVTGSNVATESNPNKITFPFVPKLVIVSDDSRHVMHSQNTFRDDIFIWMQGVTSDRLDSSEKYRQYSLSGTTLSWWTTDTNYACAVVGKYIAFG